MKKRKTKRAARFRNRSLLITYNLPLYTYMRLMIASPNSEHLTSRNYKSPKQGPSHFCLWHVDVGIRVIQQLFKLVERFIQV
jgi:hypothetical protein